MIKKISTLFIVVFIFFSFNLEAATKQDILNFVNTQSVGDSKTFAVFNSYKTTFTRLLKQKYLTSEQCDAILSYLTSSVNILNSKGVTKLSDLKNLTTEERSYVYDSLSAGAAIITNAPALDSDETTSNANNDKNKNNSESKTTVSINTSDGAMEIYENGVLIDKVSAETNKFTYTGPNKIRMSIIICSTIALCISVVLYVLVCKKKTSGVNKMYKNILISFIISFSTVILATVIFSNLISKVDVIVSMLKFNNSSNETISIEMNSDKTIKKYPSYGNNYARLIIKSLDINQNIVYGDDASLLNSNIGQATWSSFPTEGDTIVLSGHNKEYMLKNIENISIGDEILIDASYATCKYIVNKIEIVSDTDYEALTINTNEETLILYTCYPFSEIVYGNKRFVVYAGLSDIEWK